MPRTYTNLTNLPEPIAIAVQADQWSRGPADASVTEILSPPRIAALTRYYEDEIVVDVADQIFALMGKVGHGILEKAGYDSFGEEQRTMKLNGYVLSGRMDRLYLEELHKHDNPRMSVWGIDDYKFTSAYVLMNAKEPGSRVHEWMKQANLYRMIAERHGFKIGQLRLVLLLRDWSVLAAKRDKDFPQKQVASLDIPLMDLDELEMWAADRIERHLEQQQILDLHGQDELIECTEEEMWARPDKWAVHKEGVAKARRLLDNKEEAEAWAVNNVKKNDSFTIEKRPGERVRCENYCDVAEFCQQFAKWTDEGDTPGKD